MAMYSAHTHGYKVSDHFPPDCLKVRASCRAVLPSPESEGLVGEGEGRFPLGGLSDTPDSLEETKGGKQNTLFKW